MKITKMFLTPNKYSRPQTKLKKVTKIAVHYVGNAGSSAMGNRNYFNNALINKKYASSHYIVGLQGEVIQCIPENEISYATNQANGYSISIECCHPQADGKFNEKTLQALTELCADLCKRYNLNPTKDIIRHYDVTGKRCPLWWVTHPEDFVRFKNSVIDFMNGGGIYMDELKKLKEQLEKLEQLVENSIEKTFNTVDEVPQWGRATVEKLIAKGLLKGNDIGLDLSYTLLRVLVINDRMGLYDER